MRYVIQKVMENLYGLKLKIPFDRNSFLSRPGHSDETFFKMLFPNYNLPDNVSQEIKACFEMSYCKLKECCGDLVTAIENVFQNISLPFPIDYKNGCRESCSRNSFHQCSKLGAKYTSQLVYSLKLAYVKLEKLGMPFLPHKPPYNISSKLLQSIISCVYSSGPQTFETCCPGILRVLHACENNEPLPFKFVTRSTCSYKCVLHASSICDRDAEVLMQSFVAHVMRAYESASPLRDILSSEEKPSSSNSSIYVPTSSTKPITECLSKVYGDLEKCCPGMSDAISRALHTMPVTSQRNDLKWCTRFCYESLVFTCEKPEIMLGLINSIMKEKHPTWDSVSHVLIFPSKPPYNLPGRVSGSIRLCMKMSGEFLKGCCLQLYSGMELMLDNKSLDTWDFNAQECQSFCYKSAITICPEESRDLTLGAIVGMSLYHTIEKGLSICLDVIRESFEKCCPQMLATMNAIRKGEPWPSTSHQLRDSCDISCTRRTLYSCISPAADIFQKVLKYILDYAPEDGYQLVLKSSTTDSMLTSNSQMIRKKREKEEVQDYPAAYNEFMKYARRKRRGTRKPKIENLREGFKVKESKRRRAIITDVSLDKHNSTEDALEVMDEQSNSSSMKFDGHSDFAVVNTTDHSNSVYDSAEVMVNNMKSSIEAEPESTTIAGSISSSDSPEALQETTIYNFTLKENNESSEEAENESTKKDELIAVSGATDDTQETTNSNFNVKEQSNKSSEKAEKESITIASLTTSSEAVQETTDYNFTLKKQNNETSQFEKELTKVAGLITSSETNKVIQGTENFKFTLEDTPEEAVSELGLSTFSAEVQFGRDAATLLEHGTREYNVLPYRLNDAEDKRYFSTELMGDFNQNESMTSLSGIPFNTSSFLNDSVTEEAHISFNLSEKLNIVQSKNHSEKNSYEQQKPNTATDVFKVSNKNNHLNTRMHDEALHNTTLEVIKVSDSEPGVFVHPDYGEELKESKLMTNSFSLGSFSVTNASSQSGVTHFKNFIDTDNFTAPLEHLSRSYKVGIKTTPNIILRKIQKYNQPFNVDDNAQKYSDDIHKSSIIQNTVPFLIKNSVSSKPTIKETIIVGENQPYTYVSFMPHTPAYISINIHEPTRTLSETKGTKDKIASKKGSITDNSSMSNTTVTITSSTIHATSSIKGNKSKNDFHLSTPTGTSESVKSFYAVSNKKSSNIYPRNTRSPMFFASKSTIILESDKPKHSAHSSTENESIDSEVSQKNSVDCVSKQTTKTVLISSKSTNEQILELDAEHSQSDSIFLSPTSKLAAYSFSSKNLRDGTTVSEGRNGIVSNDANIRMTFNYDQALANSTNTFKTLDSNENSVINKHSEKENNFHTNIKTEGNSNRKTESITYDNGEKTKLIANYLKTTKSSASDFAVNDNFNKETTIHRITSPKLSTHLKKTSIFNERENSPNSTNAAVFSMKTEDYNNSFSEQSSSLKIHPSVKFRTIYPMNNNASSLVKVLGNYSSSNNSNPFYHSEPIPIFTSSQIHSEYFLIDDPTSSVWTTLGPVLSNKSTSPMHVHLSVTANTSSFKKLFSGTKAVTSEQNTMFQFNSPSQDQSNFRFLPQYSTKVPIRSHSEISFPIEFENINSIKQKTDGIMDKNVYGKEIESDIFDCVYQVLPLLKECCLPLVSAIFTVLNGEHWPINAPNLRHCNYFCYDSAVERCPPKLAVLTKRLIHQLIAYPPIDYDEFVINCKKIVSIGLKQCCKSVVLRHYRGKSPPITDDCPTDHLRCKWICQDDVIKDCLAFVPLKPFYDSIIEEYETVTATSSVTAPSPPLFRASKLEIPQNLVLQTIPVPPYFKDKAKLCIYSIPKSFLDKCHFKLYQLVIDLTNGIKSEDDQEGLHDVSTLSCMKSAFESCSVDSVLAINSMLQQFLNFTNHVVSNEFAAKNTYAIEVEDQDSLLKCLKMATIAKLEECNSNVYEVLMGVLHKKNVSNIELYLTAESEACVNTALSVCSIKSRMNIVKIIFEARQVLLKLPVVQMPENFLVSKHFISDDNKKLIVNCLQILYQRSADSCKKDFFDLIQELTYKKNSSYTFEHIQNRWHCWSRVPRECSTHSYYSIVNFLSLMIDMPISTATRPALDGHIQKISEEERDVITPCLERLDNTAVDECLPGLMQVLNEVYENHNPNMSFVPSHISSGDCLMTEFTKCSIESRLFIIELVYRYTHVFLDLLFAFSSSGKIDSNMLKLAERCIQRIPDSSEKECLKGLKPALDDLLTGTLPINTANFKFQPKANSTCVRQIFNKCSLYDRIFIDHFMRRATYQLSGTAMLELFIPLTGDAGIHEHTDSDASAFRQCFSTLIPRIVSWCVPGMYEALHSLVHGHFTTTYVAIKPVDEDCLGVVFESCSYKALLIIRDYFYDFYRIHINMPLKTAPRGHNGAMGPPMASLETCVAAVNPHAADNCHAGLMHYLHDTFVERKKIESIISHEEGLVTMSCLIELLKDCDLSTKLYLLKQIAERSDIDMRLETHAHAPDAVNDVYVSDGRVYYWVYSANKTSLKPLPDSSIRSGFRNQDRVASHFEQLLSRSFGSSYFELFENDKEPSRSRRKRDIPNQGVCIRSYAVCPSG